MIREDVVIFPRTILRTLVIAWLIFWFSSVIQDIVIWTTGTETRIERLDVDYEQSFYTWLSTLLLALASAVLCLITIFKSRSKDKFRFHWFFLSAVFLTLSMDEALSFHEIISLRLSANFENSGIFYFAWIIPGGIFVAIFFFSYLSFLAHLNPRTAALFISAGFIFVLGALGMEILAGLFISELAADSDYTNFPTYRALTNLEEGFEAGGVILFIYALLQYCNKISLRFIEIRDFRQQP